MILFSFPHTEAFIPVRDLIKEKPTLWIECNFYFYGYWSKSAEWEISLKKK